MTMTAGVLLLALLGSEAGARLALEAEDLVMNPVLAVYRDHPTALFVYRPNTLIVCPPRIKPQRPSCPDVRTNSLGLRDVERSLEKPEGVRRILSVGESTAAGAMVSIEEAYPSRVERGLRDRGEEVEVINAGIEAYTSWQIFAWLEAEGMGFDPDMVLVYVEGNDEQPTGIVSEHQFQYKVEGTDRELYERRKPLAPALAVLYRSWAYLWLRKQTLRLPTDLPSARELGPVKAVGEVRVPEEDRAEAFRRMTQLCEGRCEIVVLQPAYRGRRANSSLRDLAAELGLQYIDLMAAYEASGIEDFFIDGIHPTPEGHRVFAEAILAEL